VILSTHERGGKPVRIEVDPVLLLPARRIKALPEVPLAVQQADRHQWERAVRSFFDQVARERPEPARVDRQRLMHPVLGTQEGDWPLRRDWPGRRAGQVLGERLLERRHSLDQRAVAGCPRKRLA
jgi:hypothetical protein